MIFVFGKKHQFMHEKYKITLYLQKKYATIDEGVLFLFLLNKNLVLILTIQLYFRMNEHSINKVFLIELRLSFITVQLI